MAIQIVKFSIISLVNCSESMIYLPNNSLILVLYSSMSAVPQKFCQIYKQVYLPSIRVES